MLLLRTGTPCPRLCQRQRKLPERNGGSSLCVSRGAEGQRLLLGTRLWLPRWQPVLPHRGKATATPWRERGSTPK